MNFRNISSWSILNPVVPLVLFLALMVVMGVYPKPFIDRIEPSVDRVIAHVEAHSDYVAPEVTKGPAPERPSGTVGHSSEGEGE